MIKIQATIKINANGNSCLIDDEGCCEFMTIWNNPRYCSLFHKKLKTEDKGYHNLKVERCKECLDSEIKEKK